MQCNAMQCNAMQCNAMQCDGNSGAKRRRVYFARLAVPEAEQAIIGRKIFIASTHESDGERANAIPDYSRRHWRASPIATCPMTTWSCSVQRSTGRRNAFGCRLARGSFPAPRRELWWVPLAIWLLLGAAIGPNLFSGWTYRPLIRGARFEPFAFRARKRQHASKLALQ
jgi:hypothetical protein